MTLVAVLALAVPLAFALYTGHAWEDYYITYRTSKHAATGQGLVFNVGERLHTFTSPLGVLLPALASLLTFNRSDTAALWLFRLMSIGAFVGAALFLFRATRRQASAFGAAALVGWLCTDSKIVDFTINGMEIGFLLLFFAYAYWAMQHAAARRPLHVGLAWAGLMWTRPDSFIYIAAFAFAWLLLNRATETGLTRAACVRLFLRAAIVATLAYLPWFAFAWWYFGTPVPHTIIAKGIAAGPRSLAGLWSALPELPQRAWSAHGPLQGLYLPAYAMMGGWPGLAVWVGRWLAVIAAFFWVVPRLPTAARAASLSLLAALVYLAYYPPFVFPWYLCLPALLGIIAWSGFLGFLFGREAEGLVGTVRRAAAVAVAAAIVATTAWLSWQSARQLKAQQQLIEIDTRKAVGLWLKAHAQPGDTVMLEPLGYVGFYSGLRTYDVPGLASPDVVRIIAQQGYHWGNVAAELKPTWLMLRPHEVTLIQQTHPDFFVAYTAARAFNMRERAASAPVYGREYLLFDCEFTLYRRRAEPSPPAQKT